ncbi:hypothetical protein J3A64_004443 [Pseudarthrobacter sp. PvP004]|uniref:hypothetical protein n=1 Tax=Pseudarthrobacter sp. PvP004 TaxID=2817850 RepID=UPI001AE42BEF|nr:hypothetical protein [Pseudarthrobacter sp. PvP004]MBP2268979.1 hypothetical protein [Pseudarthrobacter sp. PvP004]
MDASTENPERNYWLGLSGMYGLTLSVVAMAAWPWPLIMVASFLLFAVMQAVCYRQLGRQIQGKLATANPGGAALAGTFGLGAILLQGAPIALWAGPVLGLATFAGTYLYLRKFGRFHRDSSAASA